MQSDKAVYNPYTLENRHVLVTGASSGIGRQTAIECSRLGASVIITARDKGRLEETMSLLAGDGHSSYSADLSNPDEVGRLSEIIPPIDGLVSNAGFNFVRLIPFIKESDLASIFSVNTFAPIELLHWLVKKKKLQKNSSVVFTASISARSIASAGNSIYSATKGALVSFMKTAALELSPKGIRCNAVLPGMIETSLKEKKTEVTEEQWEKDKQKYPLGRFGSPKDVALAITYLLSDAASWITGAELTIDGGRTLV